MPAPRLRKAVRDNNVIGIFDSGLGGLSVLRRVREALPQHDLLFFADQAHVPYGERTETNLHELLIANLEFLCERGVQAIVAACNTSCAIADRFGWPRIDVPVLDLIESAAIAVQESSAKRIGIVATTATARSGSYARHIVGRIPDARVIEVAAPALVPLVEAGRTQTEEAREAVAAACEPLAGNVDAIVLGCTHYPLLLDHFEASGAAPLVIDPAFVHARRAAELAASLEIAQGSGSLTCVSNGDQAAFELAVERVLRGFAPA